MYVTRSESRREAKKQKKLHRRRRWRVVGLLAGAVVILGCAYWLMGSGLIQKLQQGLFAVDTTTPVTTKVPDKTEPTAPANEDEQGEPLATDTEEGSLVTSAPELAPTPEAAEAKTGENGSKTLQLAFVGDVLLGEYVSGLMDQHGYDYPYRMVRKSLEGVDLAVANLEHPVTERGVPVEKQYVYKGSPAALPAFREAGFNLVTLANNHILDQGLEGLEDTLQALKDTGLMHVGAGMNEEEAYKPVIQEINGIRVAFVGLSRVVPPPGTWKATADRPGVAEAYDVPKALRYVEAAAKQADVVVTLIHWGEMNVDKPADYQRELGKSLIDAGADLVIGSHAHVLQGFEQYNGKWIAYSLGNFVFSAYPKDRAAETGMLQASCDIQGSCTMSLEAMKVVAGQTLYMNEDEASGLYKHLSENSFGSVIVDETGNIRVKR